MISQGLTCGVVLENRAQYNLIKDKIKNNDSLPIKLDFMRPASI